LVSHGDTEKSKSREAEGISAPLPRQHFLRLAFSSVISARNLPQANLLGGAD